MITSAVSPKPVMLVANDKYGSKYQAFYDMADDIRIDERGSILKRSYDDVRGHILTKYALYHHTHYWQPEEESIS